LITSNFAIRGIQPGDRHQWLPLWNGYNAFYGREGTTALPLEITEATWQRFFDEHEPVHALVAESADGLLGIAHFLYHRSTTRLHPVCYLQDLFTTPAARGRGVGRALIEGVYEAARDAGSSRVYWQTQASNLPGRALYDRIASHLGFIVYSKEL
jgi:GNAT superfamily N-acetyltransferase